MVCNADDKAARKDNSQGFIRLPKEYAQMVQDWQDKRIQGLQRAVGSALADLDLQPQMGGMDLSEWVVEKSMKCNNCGPHMKMALYRSEGWSERLVILDDYNPATGRYKTTGAVVYCPKCGNLQVKLDMEA